MAISTHDQISWETKQVLRTTEAQKLRASHPELVPSGSGASACVTAAKNIRIELKRAFPGIKFSVKSSSYWMGNSIDVAWTDGPTTKQVDAIIHKYSSGSFDGMTDCYNYESSVWTDAFGSSKYVHSNRHYSDALIVSVLASLEQKYGTFDGAVIPTLEEYKSGASHRSPWDRTVNLALCDTARSGVQS